MAIQDDKLISDSRFRVEVITYRLVTSTGDTRDRIYNRMVGSKVFGEFAHFRQGDTWLSFALVQQQFAFPHRLIDHGAALTDEDVLFLIGVEEAHRERRQRAAILIDTADQIHTLSNTEVMKRLASVTATKPLQSAVLDGRALYAARRDRPKGLLTGIQTFDDKTRGLGYGTITTILGWTASYKTVLKNCIMYNAASMGYNCADIALEWPKDDQYFRYLSRHSYHPKFVAMGMQPVNSLLLQKCELTPEQEKFLWEVVEPDFKALPWKIHILEQTDIPGWDYLTLKAFFERLGDIDVFGVDYVQMLMMEALGFRDPKECGNWVINEFRKLAVGSANPDEPGDYGQRKIGILVSQSNRDGWTEAVENNGAYSLRALSDLNMLERASSYVIAVYLDEMLRSAGQSKCQLLKHRGGEPVVEPIPVEADPRYSVIGNNIEGYCQAPETPAAALDIFSGQGMGVFG
jgi:hypothetical protein